MKSERCFHGQPGNLHGAVLDDLHRDAAGAKQGQQHAEHDGRQLRHLHSRGRRADGL